MVNNKKCTRAWRKMRINPLPKKKIADFDYRDETEAIERALLLNAPGHCIRKELV